MFFQACSKDSFDFSSLYAFFVFDNSTHQNPTLQSALNPLSPGVFCRISEENKNGTVYFNFESNQGTVSPPEQADATDLKRTRALGTYNKTGIIVGYGNLTSPAIFYCYDSQCPNCYAESNTPAYKLSMSSNGIATCAKCKRTYDLNNNGLCTNANGKKLIKYRATTTGPLGILSVNN